MFNRLWNKLKGLFKKNKGPKERSKPNVKAGDVIGGVTIGYLGLKPKGEMTQKDVDRLREAQLNKHTDFKVGESYRLGEMIVTLHPNKASMLAAIAAVDARREAKIKRLTRRAEDIMLMSPKELEAFQLNEWLEKRKRVSYKIAQRMAALSYDRYIAPVEKVPSGKKKERFQEIMDKSDIKKKETVN